MKKYLFLALCCLPAFYASGQMWNGTDTLYGNEWIDYSKTYYRIRIGERGIYRITQDMLAGTALADKAAAQFRLYAYGRQVPIYVSTDNTMGSGDYLEFYADKNRDQLDRFLFDNPAAENINPEYSLFHDTASYYLTWDIQTPPLRIASASNELNNLPAPLPWCWYTAEQVYTDAYLKRSVAPETTFSWFDGNGFALGGSTSSQLNLSFQDRYEGGPDALASIRYACNLGEHKQAFSLNDTPIAADSFYSWRIVEKIAPIPSSALGSGNVKFSLSSQTGEASDRHHIAYTRLLYARQWKFNNASSAFFSLPPAADKQYLEIGSFNTNGQNPVLYDLKQHLRYETVVENGLIKVALPPSTEERTFLLVQPQGGLKNPGKLTQKQFNDYTEQVFDYVLLSNPALYGNGTGPNYVQAYADYRSSAAGGGHEVLIADIYELYEQYAYGVRFHPLAVRNFLHLARKKQPKFEHVFLVGKALEHQHFRRPAEQAEDENVLFFVPTFSAPGADLPFVLKGNRLSEPVVAIGRLAATTPEDIAIYLSKVQEHEQILPNAAQNIAGKSWMKRVLHNSGGGAGETGLIKDYTSGMADILKNNRFGAEVHPFYKTSNDPIQLSGYQQILNLVNSGVSIWSIFGHSSANAVDFDIGAPANYNNKGRYPFLIVMGCFSGLCSNKQDGLGEQFIFAKDKGVIAYIASVNYSFIDALNVYARQYYSQLGGADYNNSIGVAYKNTVGALQNSTYSSLIAILHQSLLQGDPVIKLNLSQGPDYTLDPASVRFNPNPISLEQNKVRLDMDVVNLGENIGGDLALSIEQRLPDGSTQLKRILDTIPAPGNRESLQYDLNLEGSTIGYNRFYVKLDPLNAVQENPAVAEMNNDLSDASGEAGQDVYIFAEDIQPIWPPNYGIVSDENTALSASTLNSNAKTVRYLFEMDTTETFGSPAKKTQQMLERGGLIQWKIPFTLKDSTVYYWRIARDSLVNGAVVWRTSSFLYLKNSPQGWNQSHYGQFRSNDFVNMFANDSLRRLEFVDDASFSNISVSYRGENRYPGLYNAYLEGMRGDYGFNVHGLDQGVLVAVSDPANGRYWVNPIGGPYSFDPPYNRFYYWFLTRDSLQRIRLMDFIENVVPPGHYVSLLCTGLASDSVSYAPQRWANDSITYGKNLFQVLEAQGARRVREIAQFTGAPPAYGLFFKKGQFGFPTVDTINRNPSTAIEMRATFLAKWPKGYFENSKIGPARQWKSLHWSPLPVDDSSDESDLYVYGMRELEGDTLLFHLENSFDTLLTSVDANRFPYLKLRYETRDTVPRTVTPLRYLRVLYEGLPEGALAPSEWYQFYADTLQQGEMLKTAVAFRNISSLPMDSVQVRFKIDGPGNADQDKLRRYKVLPSQDSLLLQFESSTAGLNGPQRLFIDVNPDNDQPEAYHFNNVLVRDFYVNRDKRNPLLDVTIDGQHVLDGDLISPKPEVVITLRDDNPYLALADTATFSMSLLLPDGNTQNITYASPDVQFFPATQGQLPQKNQARLEWRPVFTQDGDYRLQVNGRDASGNLSATLDWSLSFKVLTRSSISNILNYPNPFNTSTCFAYTMTGAETPADFRLQIMTVSGRVVREVTAAEFGPLRAGKHLSDFCWDGRDQFGDQLANGVYLYKVTAKKADGKAFDMFENDQVDGYFKHGFGKMVLMR